METKRSGIKVFINNTVVIDDITFRSWLFAMVGAKMSISSNFSSASTVGAKNCSVFRAFLKGLGAKR